MIRVERVEKPLSLTKNERKWVLKIQVALDLVVTASTPKEQKIAKTKLDNALNKYGQEDIKNALVEKMFYGKCAYCEAKITHIDYGDIEHFRPKDMYPLLAVEWENLLFACGVCNGAEFKGTKFPMNNANEPLLLNPCEDEPNDHLEFEFDEMTNLAIVVAKSGKGTNSIETYGLNRNRSNDDLLHDRSSFVKKLILLAIYYQNDQDCKKILDQACENSSEYSAFAKMVKEKYVNSTT